MPNYDYRCHACSKRFSVHLTIAQHDKRRTKCPKCGSTRLGQRVEAFFAVTSRKS